jgi:HSP20 family protein
MQGLRFSNAGLVYFKMHNQYKKKGEKAMSNLIRWEPAREMVTLREAMDRLFDDAFTRPFGLASGLQAPAVDLYQTDEEVVVRASLPGMKAEDVQISITGDLLTLKGEFKEKEEKKEKAYHLREQRFESFERILSLPAEVVADKAKADFEDGVLTITIPKADEVKPRTITVKAK